MSTETIRLKLELSSIKTYAGGKDQLLDDIKNAGIVIHNDSNGYYITSESETKYSASTAYAEKLNELKTLTVLSPDEAEIAKLKILFLDNETDEPYAVPDNATIEGEMINLTFNPAPPAPTLPTVLCVTYFTGNYVKICYPGSFLNLYENAELVPYDSTKTHIARVSDGHGGWNEWQFSCIEYAGDIAVKNMTSDELSTYAARLFSCSSTQAEIIYVYNSSNEKYQAFKYTQNGTDYYYVADSVQNDWTDDLSSIGYSLLPTVYTGYFNAGNGNAQKEAVVSWGSTGDQYEGVYPLNSDTAYQFNASATYTIISVFYTSGETVTNETLAPYSISGSVKMINNPWASGELMLKTMVNNRITGRPCGCTFTVE